MRLAGSSSASALLESLQRIVGVEGAAVPHRTEGGWRIEAASGDRIPESPEASSATIPLDDEHVLVLASPVRSEDQRVLDALRPGAHRVGGARRAGGGGPSDRDARRRERASRRLALRRLRTTSGHRSRRVKASVTEPPPGGRRGGRTTSGAEFLHTIDEEADRLNALVGNLLDMSRIQAGALEISAVPIGVEEVLLPHLHSLGLEDGDVELDVSESLPRVLADPGLLERALANVIQNAVRFSPAGRTPGSLPARSTGSSTSASPTGAQGAERRARAHVRTRSSVSAMRRTARASASASPVAKGFIEAMGGEIVRSRTRRAAASRSCCGCGRRSEPHPRRRRRAAAPARARHEPQARGYEVDLAPTGERRSTLAARKHPDLVILDLGLPGIDGVEVIRGPPRLDARADHRPLGPRDGALEGRGARCRVPTTS